jgi:hypothetical protein
MFMNALAGAIDAVHPKQIDYLSRQLWQAHAAGHTIRSRRWWSIDCEMR